MEPGASTHVPIRTQCGICDRTLLSGPSFVPLLGSEVSPDVFPSLGNPIYPREGVVGLFFHGRWICWAQKCWRCTRFSGDREAIGVHSDCLSLFKDECKTDDAIDRLWTTALSRVPWLRAPNFRLSNDNDLAIELVHETAEKYGISGLKLLPPELIQMVRDFSGNATFWRYIAALKFGRDLSRRPAKFSSRIKPVLPLCDISSWVREGEPILVRSPDQRPIIRLILDCQGIKQVERLAIRPSYESGRSDNMAFVVQDESELTKITAHFKYGVLRLGQVVYEPKGKFHVWDISNPPNMEDCHFYGPTDMSERWCERFWTIDLQTTTGLTFFFRRKKVYGIHAHTARKPYAKSTFERLPKTHQPKVTWVYLPIPRGEEVVAVGRRSRPERIRGTFSSQIGCFLFRTKLAGDVAVGPYDDGEYKDHILSSSAPRLLIYNSHPLTVQATLCGAYPGDQEMESDFSPSLPSGLLSHAPGAAFSSAPLKHVTRIQVFYDEKNNLCQAILLDYQNGAQRAVGNCRLGFDPVKTYLNPSRVCLSCPQRSLDSGFSCVVESGSDSSHSHDEAGWICAAMEGNFECWSTGQESLITIDSMRRIQSEGE